MKRICLLICILSLISGCATKKEENNQNNQIEKLEFKLAKKDNCDNQITEYYKYDSKNIYFVCLNELYISNQNATLSYYLNQNDKSIKDKIEDIKSNLNYKDSLNDGGTKIYKNDNMTLIECHRTSTEGKYNEDIYIGDENLEFSEDFCSR